MVMALRAALRWRATHECQKILRSALISDISGRISSFAHKMAANCQNENAMTIFQLYRMKKCSHWNRPFVNQESSI
jgi:hypothetical protein